jgi:hypothetical protein
MFNKRKIINGLFLLSIIGRRGVRRVLNKPIIWVVGDSHSLLFKSPIFNTQYIGPATAFRLGSSESTNNSREKIMNFLKSLNKKKNYKVLFVFGEIDCRIHINKTVIKTRNSENKIIYDTAGKYIEFIKELQLRFPNVEILVFNILPSGEQGNFYNIENYADRKKRMEITRRLNTALLNECKKEVIPFINVFDSLVTKNDERVPEYIFDDVHYNSKIIPIILQNFHMKKII